MAEARFQPGFRMSAIDGVVIIFGIVGAVALWSTAWWLGFIVAFVVGHFFVFCNVFRVARPLELAWSGLVIVLTYCTVMFGRPTWAVMIGCSLLATAVAIGLEMRKASYHGVLWRRINPGLRQWWEERGGFWRDPTLEPAVTCGYRWQSDGAWKRLNYEMCVRSLCWSTGCDPTRSPAGFFDTVAETLMGRKRMRVVCSLAVCCLLCMAGSGIAAEPAAETIVKQAVLAAGGEEKLLKLFRTRETVNVSADPEKKVAERVSVYEPPKYWWTGKNERVKDEKKPEEPAIFLAWAWTLGILMDPASKLEVIAEVVETDKPAVGLRVSGTVTPAMDLYFDKAESRLVRIDWRSDIHRFSDWKEQDGAKYPAKCAGYKKATGKPWYFSEIIELERLQELPAGLKRR